MSDYLFECHDKCMKSDPSCLRWYEHCVIGNTAMTGRARWPVTMLAG